MHLDEFQRIAQETDQRPGSDDVALIVPLLGLVSEAATLQGEFKKRLRDGATHARFSEQVGEELGDVLWYAANIAHKAGLSLDDIAERNLKKTRARWLKNQAPRVLFDGVYPPAEQLPREFQYTFAYTSIDGVQKIVLLDNDGVQVGNPLTDNANKDDGYRFHDVLHLGHAAVLGWSPVFRKLIGRKRRSDPKVDDVEDTPPRRASSRSPRDGWPGRRRRRSLAPRASPPRRTARTACSSRGACPSSTVRAERYGQGVRSSCRRRRP